MGDRWGDEARIATIRGYNVFDLMAKYKWGRYEFLFSIIKVADKNAVPLSFFTNRN